MSLFSFLKFFISSFSIDPKVPVRNREVIV